MLSLAQFISEMREKKGLSQSGFAKRANLTLKQIEDIESGQELFLPSTIRQRIAKVLHITPFELKQYEKSFTTEFVSNDEISENIKQKILANDIEDLLCPVCESKMVTKIERMYDLEDNLVLLPKAHCTRCPYQVK